MRHTAQKATKHICITIKRPMTNEGRSKDDQRPLKEGRKTIKDRQNPTEVDERPLKDGKDGWKTTKDQCNIFIWCKFVGRARRTPGGRRRRRQGAPWRRGCTPTSTRPTGCSSGTEKTQIWINVFFFFNLENNTYNNFLKLFWVRPNIYLLWKFILQLFITLKKGGMG